LERVASDLGTDHVSRAQWVRQTGINEWHVLKQFDSWNALVLAAGLQPDANRRLSDDELFEAMAEAFVAAQGLVPRQHFPKYARYSPDVYRKRWGAWPNVLRAFRSWLDATGRQFRYYDQLPATSSSMRPATAAASEPARPAHSRPTTGARRYGPILNFRGLLHAPVNEQGVVFLFGMVAFELGYIIESVQEGYPDCEGKRRVGPDAWERVRIEFEYLSRTFRDHGHDPASCDLIICWEDNWPEAPLPVLALRAALQTLAK
jgi:hypothetical protein